VETSSTDRDTVIKSREEIQTQKCNPRRTPAKGVYPSRHFLDFPELRAAMILTPAVARATRQKATASAGLVPRRIAGAAVETATTASTRMAKERLGFSTAPVLNSGPDRVKAWKTTR